LLPGRARLVHRYGGGQSGGCVRLKDLQGLQVGGRDVRPECVGVWLQDLCVLECPGGYWVEAEPVDQGDYAGVL